MSHEYLIFSDSKNDIGSLVVGSTSSITGNGLSNENITKIRIPSAFESKTISEIGPSAFSNTKIKSVFIPKTIKILGQSAFFNCKSLKKVIFEKGSELEQIGINAFRYCRALIRINFPPSLTTINSSVQDYIFKGANALECFSYLGSSNFTSSYLFSTDKVIVHVSKDYPFDTLGRNNVTSDAHICESKAESKFYPIIIQCLRFLNYIICIIIIVHF